MYLILFYNLGCFVLKSLPKIVGASGSTKPGPDHVNNTTYFGHNDIEKRSTYAAHRPRVEFQEAFWKAVGAIEKIIKRKKNLPCDKTVSNQKRWVESVQ